MVDNEMPDKSPHSQPDTRGVKVAMDQPYTQSPEQLPSSSVKGTRDNGELSLKDLLFELRELRKYAFLKWRIILIAVLIGSALGFIYANSRKPVYKAETTFVLEEGNAGGGMVSKLGGLASLAGIDAGEGGGLFQANNIIQLYQSRSMIEKALLSKVHYNNKKELLLKYYLDFNNLGQTWDRNEKSPELNPENNDRVRDSILGVAVQNIKNNNLSVVKPDNESSIIKVEVKAIDEFFAKSFNDLLVQNVNDFYVQTKTKKAIQNLAILQHQTDSVRNVLNGAIYATAAVADATPNLNPTRQVLRAPAQRSQFNAEANRAILTQLVQNLELAKLSLRKETPLIQVVDTPVYPLVVAKFGKLKGLILGGFISGFITVLILIMRKKYLQIMKAD